MPDMWIDVDTAITVPVNVLPLLDDTTFKDIEESVAYNAAGMDLNWNFVTSAGVVSQTNVTPTTSGVHDWTHVGNGIYKIEIPDTGGTVDNDTEGYGWFSGVCDGVLPWCGPRIGFRAAALNDALCDGGDNLDINLVQWLGQSAAAVSVNGVPEVDITHIGGQAVSGYNATLKLKQLDIQNSAGSGLVAKSTGSNGHGVEVAGNGTGEGLSATGGATGEGIEALGGASGGAGIRAAAAANNDAGLELVKHGTGKDIDADETDNIGAAVALDGAAATLAGMLTKMADDNGGANFDAETDSQRAIATALAAAAPVLYVPDSSSTITTGDQGATSYANAASDDNSPWTIGDENGTNTIEVICEMNMGADRIPAQVDVNGYYNRSGGGGYVVEVYAYNYTTSSYDKLSHGTIASEMRHRTSDTDYVWALNAAHTDRITTPGEVKIRFVSTRGTTAGGDVLRLDYVRVTGVAAGVSAEAVADAVWEHILADSATESSAGYVLHRTRALVTDVDTGNTTTSFTLLAGCAVNDCYNGMLIMVEDETDDHYEVRRITDWTSSLVVTVDRAFGFTPASGDHVYIMATGYLETMRGTDSASTHNAAAVVTALFAKTGITAGGSASYEDIVKVLYADARGRVAKSTDDYEYYDDDGDVSGGTKLFENRISSSARTPQ